MTARFHVGDRVKAVLGKTVVEGEVRHIYVSGVVLVRADHSSVHVWVPTDGTDGWTVEVPEPEPPNRTVVLDCFGVAWQRHGLWWHSTGGTIVDSFDALGTTVGPLTLLEVAS